MFAVAIAMLGIGIALPAHAQYFGKNKVQYRQYDWRSIESDHFQIYFYPELDSLARRVLDLAEKTNARLSVMMGHQLGRRIPIILYGSHNDFAQTNVTPELIDAGTGGFTELLRNRVVLPFMGPYEDLRHVVVHELVHAFMFDMLYGGAAGAMLARQSFYQVPLWFAEGLAEYVSLGMESNAEMFLRDGTITGYLPPLMYSGGYIVYKQGQSAVSYLVERFGDERLRDLLQRIRQMRSFEGAFQKSLGVPVGRFDEQWRSWLRKRYWPTVASKEDPEHFARRLTDHRREQNYVNTAPAVSPQGDRVVFVSDRRQYTDVYLMSAFDGKVLRRVIRGERNVQFESIPSFRAALTWSPDGSELALVAKSGGYDRLYVISAESGKILKRFDLGNCPALSYPSWSPHSDSIAVVGVKGDRADIYLVDRGNSRLWRLTNDTYDEMELTWRPDGSGLTFSSDRLAPVVLHPLRREKGHGAYGIFGLDLATREITQVLDTQGEDHSPAWSADGSKLAFISDRGGTPNIFLWDAKDGSITQLTDVLGGVTSLSWSRQHDRLVFAAFNNGGVDIFGVREALSLDPVLDRLRSKAPQAIVSTDGVEAELPDSVEAPPTLGALAGSWPDTLSGPDSTLMAREDPPRGPTGSGVLGNHEMNEYDNAPWTMGGPARGWAPSDTTQPLPTRSPLKDEGGPFAVADSVLSQKPAKYRGRLSADYAGAGFYASTLGVIGQSQFAFSDFLGNHSLFLATDVISDDLTETNALVVYSYLPRRWDFSGGFFHFKNYYSSQISPLGEQLGTARLFSERSYGGLLQMAYPFSRFRRLEFGYTQMFVERQFFYEDANGVIFEGGKQNLSVSSPSVSLVGDNSLFGYYGPVNGGRYNITYSPSLPLFNRGLSYHTAVLDVRKYWDMTHGHSFAARALAGWSDGDNPQTFEVGGFSTLRGYDDFSIFGSRLAIANFEYRFPFIQQLGIVGPLPLGLFNLRGVGFLDVGNAWYGDYTPRLTRVVDGRRRLNDVKVGYGTGIRTAFSFFIIKVDVAWSTDFVFNSQPRWYFSIGPEF